MAETKEIVMKRVPFAPLHELVTQLMRQSVLPQEDADIVADALVTSELRNLPGQGQGVRRVRSYIRRAAGPGIDEEAPFDVLKESPALALVDAHNGSGTVMAVKAMRLAVEKAHECGVGVVLVRHSTHLGSASYSASQAMPHHCIGVTLTNAGPEMAPWGGIDPVVGTNPWAVAIPTADDPDALPIILDMALTMSGKGMMKWLMREGRKMPKNWALTPEGHETDEPAEAMDGPLLPIGEYKGYGLSFITDVLTGVLSGSAYGTVPYSDRNFLDVGHQFIAYHIDWFMAREAFYRRMADFIGMVRASRTRPGFDEILLPGEPEWRRSQDKKRNGVPLEQSVYEDLRTLSEELGVAWPFE